MTRPLVSIGLPVFNEAKHLRETLDSLLAQTYRGIEVVVSDNASTDATGEIAREYAARDPRVRYFRQPSNVGASMNFNRAFMRARGEFFHWSAGHDSHHPELIAKSVEVLGRNPRLALCYPPVRWEDGTDAGGRVDTGGARDPLVRLGQVLRGTSGGAVYGVFRTEMLRRTRLFERVVASDVLLLAELAAVGGFAHIDGPELVLKQGPDYGDWAVYVGKIFGQVPAKPHRLYRRALLRLCVRSSRHVRLRDKPRAFRLAARAFRERFAWIDEGLRGLGALPPP